MWYNRKNRRRFCKSKRGGAEETVKVTVIAPGTLSERAYAEAFEEYRKRFRAFGAFECIELKEKRLGDRPSPAQIAAALFAEGEDILSRVPPRSFVFAMAVEGKKLSSEGFAELLDRRMIGGAGEFCFIVGSSYGLSPEVKSRADFLLSMSDMTFPHQLARVMLAEQIYRAAQILAGGKYHK